MKHECECECGNRRVPDQEACPRCLYLDGCCGPEARVIAHMRDAGSYITSIALRKEMGISREYMCRLLRKLIDAGRVTRIRLGGDAALFCLVDDRPSTWRSLVRKQPKEARS